jgi:hypothetical protein
LFHEIADGIELDADAVNVMRGSGGGTRGGGYDSSGEGCFDEGSTVHGAECTPWTAEVRLQKTKGQLL